MSPTTDVEPILWGVDDVPFETVRAQFEERLGKPCHFHLPGRPLMRGLYESAVEHRVKHVVLSMATTVHSSLLHSKIMSGDLSPAPKVWFYHNGKCHPHSGFQFSGKQLPQNNVHAHHVSQLAS